MNEFLIMLFSISFSGSISFFLFLLLDKILPPKYVNWQLGTLKIMLLFFLLPNFFIPYYYFSTQYYTFETSGEDFKVWIVANSDLDRFFSSQVQLITCIILSIWFLGFLFMIFKSILKSRKTLNIIIQSSELIDDIWIVKLKKSLMEELKIKKDIPIYHTNSLFIASPCIFGVIHPVILLPKTDIELSTKNLELILRHELSHYKRKDHLFNYIIILFLSTHWFNPFIWHFINKLHDFTEIACDSLVLEYLSKEERSLYSELLLNSINEKAHFYNVTNLMSANEKFMQKRLYNIMRPYKKHRILSAIFILSLLLSTPITTYAASEHCAIFYNKVLTQFPRTVHLPLIVDQPNEPVEYEEHFSLEPKGVSAISKTLAPNEVKQTDATHLKAGQTIEISLMNSKTNGNFQVEIILSGHTIVSKKSTDKTTVLLNYTTKQSGDFAIKIKNLSSNTIKVTGSIEVN